MPWRERLLDASFRGVAFHVRASRVDSGRRLHVHEFPRHDVGIVEDLGKKTPTIDVEGVVIGPEYDRQRDRLLDALDQSGPGDLSHPYHGLVRVAVDGYSFAERSDSGGMCSVTIKFVRVADQGTQIALADTVGQAESAADTARDAIAAAGISEIPEPETARDVSDARLAVAGVADAIEDAVV